ncbi:RNA-guided endonuclease TnpB family protein [Bacillus sp. ISL-7]|uniref:RNA-guided endonuclease InsQ/TnpB family protein n=1 Tax=Bacillus sp. ISL-7 TaxID=2819136 RepID=UPI001BE9901B|nr:RNA-guided endonuclease TnpB family protein [Bacillus sp. ISL-7]MBT2738340.1 transposase [Bacillus sp. ISL-7]
MEPHKKNMKEQKKKESKGDIVIRKFPLRLTGEERRLVDTLRKEAANLWNDCLDLHWWLYDAYQVWTSASEKKQWYNATTHKLHSQTIQSIIELHEETCKRTRELRTKGEKQWRYPWKYKKFFSVKYKKTAIKLSGKKLRFSNGKQQSPLVIPQPKHIDFHTIKSAEIVWHKNHYWMHIAVEVPKQKQVQGKKEAGCDLGLIHAAVLSNGKIHLIVTGRELRSLQRYRNKRLKEFQKLISQKKPGSNKRQKLILRKRRFLEKLERRMEYLLHSISKMVTDWCVENQIKTLYIGTPDGVQKNTKKKKKTRKEIRQQLSNWSFGQLIEKIKYKLKLRGVKVQLVEESYTSGTCPSCGEFRKQRNRNFDCHCREKGHRDVVGAMNILDKSVNKQLTKNRELPKIEDTKYRRVLLAPIVSHDEAKRAVA